MSDTSAHEALFKRAGRRPLSTASPGTMVVIGSLSFPPTELRKIVGIERYEERLLFLLLLLDDPSMRIVYVTSLPVDEAVVEAMLQLLDDPVSARARLTMIALGSYHGQGLAGATVKDERVCARVRKAAGADGFILPFNVTRDEERLSDRLGLPVYGTPADRQALGSKSGSRRLARAAGVAVMDGAEHIRTRPEVEAALARLRSAHPALTGAVIKLNYGFSGQGNALVELAREGPLERRSQFCSADEDWPSYWEKLARAGGIVEALGRPGLASPSAQGWIGPDGAAEVVSTHEQILGGPGGQVYLGCRFPADAAHRERVITAGTAIGKGLAEAGALGPYSVDFLVDDGEVIATEINLRLGGTTHPFGMARLATKAGYDPTTGLLQRAGSPIYYRASDNLKASHLRGTAPEAVLSRLAERCLAFDPSTGHGAVPHLLGALRDHGKLGLTCIAGSAEEAAERFAEAEAVLLAP